MSYTKKMITDVLISAEKIGIAKAARLFNIYRSTIYAWIKDRKECCEENISSAHSASVSNHKKLVLRRMFIKNTQLQYYIYNLKDLHSGLEFNSIAFTNNYQTPVTFLKYVLNAYLKTEKTGLFHVLLKGFTRMNNLEKFENIYDDCKIKITRTDSFFSIDSFDKKHVLNLIDKNAIIEILTDEQLCYNIIKNSDDQNKLKFHPPIILDHADNSNISRTEDLSYSLLLSSTLDRLIDKTNILIREASYNQAWSNLNIIQSILTYSDNQKTRVKFYNLKFEFFTIQSNYSDALKFLEDNLQETGKYPEVDFFIHLKICEIYIRNYNTKKFDEYYAKMKLLYSSEFDRHFLLEYDLLAMKRESLYLAVEKSISSYKAILVKYKKHISQTRLFNIYIQIISLYQSISNYKETGIILKKAMELPIVNTDKYLLCKYYESAGKCYYMQGLYNEAYEYYKLLETVSHKHNYRDFYYESQGLIALNLMNQGKFDSAKIEADKFLNYGEMTSNNYAIHKACRILERYYERTGNFNKALKFNLRVLELSDLFFNINYAATALNNRCLLLGLSGHASEMPIYINKFEKLNKILKDPRKTIQILMYKGYYYHQIDDFSNSLKYYQKALTCAKKNRITQFVYLVYSYIADLKSLLNKFKSAVLNINQSIYVYSPSGVKYDLPRLMVCKAQIYFRAKRFDKAEIYLTEAKQLALEYRNSNALELCSDLEKLLSKEK